MPLVSKTRMGKDVKGNDQTVDWHHHDVDKILHSIGRFGRYQVTQISLLYILATNMVHPALSGMFTGKHIDAHCGNISWTDPTKTQNLSDLVTLSHPDHVTNDTSSTTLHRLRSRMMLDLPSHSYISKWRLVCDRDSLGQLPQILAMVGMGVGAMTLPCLGDRYGRRTLLIGTSLGQVGVMLAMAFAQDFELFIFLKFVSGALQQGQMVPLFTAMLEVLPREERSLIGLLQTLMWVTGLCVVGLVGWIFRLYPWRQLQLAYALVMVPALLAICFLDESLRWLVVNSKNKRAESVLRKACKWNNKDFEELVRALTKSKGESKENSNDASDQAVTHTNTKMALSVVTNRNLRKITLISIYTWCICSLSYFGLVLLSTSLDGNPYVNFVLGSLVEIPSGVFIYVTMQRFGRRKIAIFCNFVSAVGLLLAAVVTSFAPPTTTSTVSMMCFTLIGKCFMSGAFSVMWLYTPELYPTNLRNIGIGLSSASARVGASLSPLFTVLARKASWAPGSMFAVCSFVSVFLLLLIPETRWKGLPRTLRDVDEWFEGRKTRGDVRKAANGAYVAVMAGVGMDKTLDYNNYKIEFNAAS